MEILGEGTGVQFDELRADAGGGFHLRRDGRDEEADFDAGVVHFPAGVGQGQPLGRDVQAAFGGQFGAAFGHQANDVGFETEGDGDDFRRVGHFQVEAGFDGLAEFDDVAVLDVPAVFAQVGGDAVGAGGFADESGFDGVRFAAIASAIAGLAQGGNVINVDPEFEHGNRIRAWLG